MWLLLIGNVARPLPLVDGVFAVFNGPIVGGPGNCLAMEGGPADCPAVGRSPAVGGGYTAVDGGPSLGCVAVGVGPADSVVGRDPTDYAGDGPIELPPDGPAVGLIDGPA